MTQMKHVAQFADFDPTTTFELSDEVVNQVIERFGIPGTSILMLGNERTKTIPYIMGLSERVVHTIDPSALKGHFHFSRAPKVTLRVSADVKLIVLREDGVTQEIMVLNEGKEYIKVYPHRSSDGIQHLNAVVEIGPGEHLPIA